ncbi:hypothetical protein ACLOJK_036030 [Asimina triloba]
MMEYNRLLSDYWADIASVRRALHIRPGTVGEWERCKHLNYVEDVQGTVGYHLNLTTKGYRALVYSGDHDLIAPFAGTQAWIRSLNFSVLEHWRPWTVDGQVAGELAMKPRGTGPKNALQCISGGFLTSPYDHPWSSEIYESQ